MTAVQGAGSALLLALGVAFILAQAYFWIGIGLPVVKEHCFVGGGPAVPLEVETRWKPAVPVLGARDGDGCVRNTPFREGLAAAGIWNLDEPRDQIEQAVAGQSFGHEEYVETMFELRRESEEQHRDLMAAQPETPAEARQVFADAHNWGETFVARKRDVVPPPELRSYHNQLLASDQRALDALEDVITAIDNRDEDQYRRAIAEFDRELERGERLHRELQRRLDDERR